MSKKIFFICIISFVLFGCGLMSTSQPGLAPNQPAEQVVQSKPTSSSEVASPQASPTSSPEVVSLQASPTAEPATTTPSPTEVTNDLCGNPFYPIVDGAHWEYNTSKGDPFTHDLTVEEDQSFFIYVVSLENTFTLRGHCTPEGINLLDVPGTSLEISGDSGSTTMSTTDSQGITIPNNIQVGDTWSQTMDVTYNLSDGQTMDWTLINNFTAIGYEEVSVQAGTFNALKIEQSTEMEGSISAIQYLWYADGVGLVKSDTLMGGELINTNQLVSYKIP